jgi:hypothetical protein
MPDDELFMCPRRSEWGWSQEDRPRDRWHTEHSDYPTCSFCGSVEPELFMSWVRTGSATLGPTDKPYKVYVLGFEPRTHKFYFQHLSVAQCAEFVDLYNAGELSLDDPYYFYVLPFFMKETR